MASKKCLVKHLEAVETLGSTSTICTDKTGTLTQNRMTVEHCWVGNIIHRVSHQKNEVQEQMSPIQKCWNAYNRCCILCSRAEFTDDNPDIMKRACSGDASETAIVRFMEAVTGPVIKYRAQYPKVAEKPFSSTYKYQYSIHKNSDINSNSKDGSISNFFLVMKGAPERIVKLCSTMITPDGGSIDIDDEVMKNFEETYRELGSMGERVIAFCDYEFTQFPPDYKFNLDEGNDFTLGNFRFLGLIALIDPPRFEFQINIKLFQKSEVFISFRPSVPDAVAKCRSAGIKVIMVTGDHPITAQAIAKMVGIFSHSHRRSTRISMPTIDNIVREGAASIVVPGDELAELRDEELRDILNDYSEIVFARTSPQQKLRIVENCQYLGQIVAVTGDGVNDSPALKKANIGIAMGVTGIVYGFCIFTYEKFHLIFFPLIILKKPFL
jgi:magnesium-transporting ATPase (P-type)